MIHIGEKYIAPPSIFSRRDAAGSYAHTLPAMSADDEIVQRAIAPGLQDPPAHVGDRAVAVACYLGLIFIAVAGVCKWF